MKPTPGTQYTTKQGDTLESISSQAFGDPGLAYLISDVNQTQAPLTTAGSITTGTDLIIPFDTDLQSIEQSQLQGGLA